MAAFAPRGSRSLIACSVLGLSVHRTLGTATYSNESKIESANLYGNVAQYGYYFMELLIGTPANQRASVIVDTGSRLVGFPCTGCHHCGEHIDQAFDISRSSTGRWVGCGDSCTSGCVEDHCSYAETYSEGSSISGFYFEDNVNLGDPRQGNPPVKVRMGCHVKENMLFYSQRANGIMGLAPSGLTEFRPPSILTQLFADKKHIKTGIFSLCLAVWGGRLTVGGYNNSYHTGTSSRDEGIQWLRLHPSNYHFVFPVGVTLGTLPDSEGLQVAWGQKHLGVTIVDSGTTYTYFPEPVYNGILNQIDAFCAGREGCGAKKSNILNAEGSECWQMLDATKEPEDFPSIGLHFDNDIRVDWRPSEYLQERDDSGTWCSTFLQNNVFQTVLGISFMLRRDVIFDLDGYRLGIAAANCPEHSQPPPLQENVVENLESLTKSIVLPHRLYSIDAALAAELGYGAAGAGTGVAPTAGWSVAPPVRAPTALAGAGGALLLLAAAALLARARSGRRPEPMCQEEARFLQDVPARRP